MPMQEYELRMQEQWRGQRWGMGQENHLILTPIDL
jgi:hypothetical protein